VVEERRTKCRKEGRQLIQSPTPASAHAVPSRPAVKRHKVRKGTFSCWECRNRKTRCDFKPVSSSSCVSCRRRGLPYTALDRFFVGLEPSWSGINAVEFTESEPVAFVRKCIIDECKVQVECLTETSHKNLVNLKEVFIAKHSTFFVYEKWGISLKEIHRLRYFLCFPTSTCMGLR
jgi:hypothetical protein